MKIYHYSSEDGQYLGIGEADICQITGQALIPAFATKIAPPSFDSSKQTCIWKNDTWILNDITKVEKQVTLADVQATAIATLKDQAAAKYIAGFTSSATGTALYYDSDDKTQSQITAAALLALASAQFTVLYPNGITIRARVNATDPESAKKQYVHTGVQIVTLSTDMQKMLAAVKAKLWDYQGKVYAATTTDAVSEIMTAVTW